MAEIQVQTKKKDSSPMWLWVVLAVLALGVIIYLLTRNKNVNEAVTPDRTTSSIQSVPQLANVYYLPAA